MSAKKNLSMSFFRLPFNPNTRILTQETLNRHSEIRKPKRTFFPIKIRKISYTNELLTLGVTLCKEDEELVYIKVTSSFLLVSCSVDTHDSYLSRYAYFSLFQLMFYYGKYDFEQYYWPGFFDEQIGLSKYLRINKSKGSLWVSAKLRYKTLYKPEQNLLMVSTNWRSHGKLYPLFKKSLPKTPMKC